MAIEAATSKHLLRIEMREADAFLEFEFIRLILSSATKQAVIGAIKWICRCV